MPIVFPRAAEVVGSSLTAMHEEPKPPAVAAAGRFSLKQRIALRVVPWLTRALLMLLGSTLRFESSWDDGSPPPAGTDQPPPGAIIAFWHACILPATYYFRARGVAIMVSSSFDGELIARVVNRLGYLRDSRFQHSRRGAGPARHARTGRCRELIRASPPTVPRVRALSPSPDHCCWRAARNSQSTAFISLRACVATGYMGPHADPQAIHQGASALVEKNRGAGQRRPRGDGNFSRADAGSARSRPSGS